MIYITQDDLLTDSYQRFIDESTADDPEAINKAEKRAIAMATTYLEMRYNTDLIFDESDPIRNEVLVDIISKITLAKVIGRNAARKVPTDIKEEADAAIKKLEKINAGTIKLALPQPVDDTGNTVTNVMWGNSTNTDHYI